MKSKYKKLNLRGFINMILKQPCQVLGDVEAASMISAEHIKAVYGFDAYKS